MPAREFLWGIQRKWSSMILHKSDFHHKGKEDEYSWILISFCIIYVLLSLDLRLPTCPWVLKNNGFTHHILPALGGEGKKKRNEGKRNWLDSLNSWVSFVHSSKDVLVSGHIHGMCTLSLGFVGTRPGTEPDVLFPPYVLSRSVFGSGPWVGPEGTNQEKPESHQDSHLFLPWTLLASNVGSLKSCKEAAVCLTALQTSISSVGLWSHALFFSHSPPPCSPGPVWAHSKPPHECLLCALILVSLVKLSVVCHHRDMELDYKVISWYLVTSQ